MNQITHKENWPQPIKRARSLEFLYAPEGTLIRCSHLHLQSLAPTNGPAWGVMARSPYV
jgi:hypothetical protein